MTATSLYVEACKRLLFLEDQDLEVSSWEDKFTLLAKLRQALSCRVCRGLLVDPYGSQSCQHFVCRGCLRKKRSLNPGCRWCLNLDGLKEDKQIRIVMACYKKLCEILITSPTIQRLCNQNSEVNRTQAILLEAISTPVVLEEQAQAVVSSICTEANRSGENLNQAEIKVGKKVPDVGVSAKRQVLQMLTETGNEGKGPRKRRRHFRGSSYFSPKRRRTSSGRFRSEDIDTEHVGAVKITDGEKTGDNTEEVGTKVSHDAVENRVKADEEVIENGNVQECVPDSTTKSEQVTGERNGEAADGSISSTEDCDVFVDVVETVNGIHEELNCALAAPVQEEISPMKNLRRGRKRKHCLCGKTVPVKSGGRRCTSARCPCYTGGLSCKDCICKSCCNPYNENNNVSSSLKSCASSAATFVRDEETVFVS